MEFILAGISDQLQSTYRNSLFSQLGKPDFGSGLESLHHISPNFLSDRQAKRFTQQGEAPSQNNRLGMKQVNRMRKPISQVIGRFIENSPCLLISLTESGQKSCRLFGGHSGTELSQEAIGLFPDRREYFSVDGPAGAAGFHCASLFIKAYMAYLDLTRIGSMVDFTIYDRASADTASQSYVHNRVAALSGSAKRFPECCRVRIVFQMHTGGAINRKNPLFEVKLIPALNLMRTDDLSRLNIDRASKTDTDSRDIEMMPPPFVEEAPNLLANPLSPQLLADLQPILIEDADFLIGDHQLEFGASNFNSYQIFKHFINGKSRC